MTATVFDARVPSLLFDRPAGVSQNEVTTGCRTSCVHRSKPTLCDIRSQGVKIFSGLTRVVWELEAVKAGTGGTSFLSGSHKAHFNYGGPDPYRPNISDSPWEGKYALNNGGLQLPSRLSSHLHGKPRPCCKRLDQS